MDILKIYIIDTAYSYVCRIETKGMYMRHNEHKYVSGITGNVNQLIFNLIRNEFIHMEVIIY